MQTLITPEIDSLYSGESNIIDFSSEKTTSANVKDLSDILKQYSEPLIDTTEMSHPDKIGKPSENITQPVTETSNQNWHGDYRYYQRGAKKGQLRASVYTPKNQAYNQPVNHQASGQPNVNVISGDLITGFMFITFIDMMLPMLIVMINNRFSKQKMKAELLQLTEKQKKALEPSCDKLVQMLKLNAHPAVILTLGLAGIYGFNFAVQKQLQNTKDKKDEKTN